MSPHRQPTDPADRARSARRRLARDLSSIEGLRRIVRRLRSVSQVGVRSPDLARAEQELDAQGIRAQAALLLELALWVAGELPQLDRVQLRRELLLARRDLRTVIRPFAAGSPSLRGVLRASSKACLADWPDARLLARTAYALAPRSSVRAVLIERHWWWRELPSEG